MAEWSIARLRADIADVLGEDPASLFDDDNLVDAGLDSIRLMTLVRRWTDAGVRVEFSELAEWPSIERWWQIVSSRLPAAHGGDGHG